MFNLRTNASILILMSVFVTVTMAQNTTMATMSAFTAANAVSSSEDRLDNEEYLPYAEPIFGMEKDAYEEHFNEYREGALMDRILDLNHMELQAIYTDSQMNEINISFNSTIQQEVVLAIYDSFGQKVKSNTYGIKDGINNYAVATRDLDEGFYSMVVTGDNDQFIQRFIIE